MCLLSELIAYLKKNLIITVLIVLCTATSIVLTNFTSLIAHEAELDFSDFQKTYNEGQFFSVADKIKGEAEEKFYNDYDYIKILEEVNEWLHSSEQFDYFEVHTGSISIDDKEYSGEWEDTYNTMLDGMWLGAEAFDYFDLSVSQGRPFSEEDFIHKENMTNDLGEEAEAEFPVILGSALAGKFSIGERIDLYNAFCRGKAVVIGFLKKGAYIPYNSGPYSLDNSFIFPFFTSFSGKESGTYMMATYFQRNNGLVYSEYSANDLQSMLNEITSSVGIPGAYCICGANNQWQPVFAKNLSDLVDGIRKLAVGITAFAAIILAIYLFIRICRSARYYGILLINGFSSFQIYMIILGEVAIIMLLSILSGTFVSDLIREIYYEEYDINLLFGFIPVIIVGLFGVVSSLIILSRREISVTIKEE